MTDNEFLNALANGKRDVIRELLEIIQKTGASYCVIGGLAVNAYAEPVVSLDIDVVVAADRTDRIRAEAEARGWKVEPFEHSVNLECPGSDLRIQIQTDPRYQALLPRSVEVRLLGYTLRVAAKADVLQGKIWACTDPTRRRSKRQKDLADIARLIEADPQLSASLPDSIREQLAKP